MQRIRLAGIIPMGEGYALMHRKDVIKNPDRQEYYVFPGGGREGEETYEEGTLREIKEEVGLDVIIDTGFRAVETYSPKEGVLKDVVYFVAYSKSMDTTMQAVEVRDIKWIELKEAINLTKFRDMQEIIMKADTYLCKTN